MRWRRGVGADQVQDRRGMRMGGVPAMGGGLGIVGILVVVVLQMLGGGGGGGGTGGFGLPNLAPVDAPSQTGGTIPPDDDEAQFVGFVVDDVQDAWKQIFRD